MSQAAAQTLAQSSPLGPPLPAYPVGPGAFQSPLQHSSSSFLDAGELGATSRRDHEAKHTPRDGRASVASAMRSSARAPPPHSGAASTLTAGARAGTLGSYARHTRAGGLATAPSMPSISPSPYLAASTATTALSSKNASLSLTASHSALSLAPTAASAALSFAATAQAPLPHETGTRPPPGSALLVALAPPVASPAYAAATAGLAASAAAALGEDPASRSQWQPKELAQRFPQSGNSGAGSSASAPGVASASPLSQS